MFWIITFHTQRYAGAFSTTSLQYNIFFLQRSLDKTQYLCFLIRKSEAPQCENTSLNIRDCSRHHCCLAMNISDTVQLHAVSERSSRMEIESLLLIHLFCSLIKAGILCKNTPSKITKMLEESNLNSFWLI